MTRLGVQWPELAEAFASLPSHRRREIAVRASLVALKDLGLPAPDGDEANVSAAVERLDEIAWDQHDDDDAADGEYDIAFRRARATNSYALATST